MNKKLNIALTIYITCLLASNTLGIKLMPFIFGTHLSVAIFVFPAVFLMTDVVGELYGKKTARQFVRMGFYATGLFTLVNLLANVMPNSPDFYLKESYDQIFSLSLRFALASLAAFFIGEYQDIFSFFFLKTKFGGKWFWLRSNLSNLWGQLIDSLVWSTIAFVGVYPLKTIILILIPWWLFKVAMGLVYTPLSYLGLKFLKEKNGQPGENLAPLK